MGLGAIIGLPQVDAGFVYSLDPKWTVHDHVFAGLHLEKSHFFSSGEDEERIGNISPKPSLFEGHRSAQTAVHGRLRQHKPLGFDRKQAPKSSKS
ncbi:MAG TPA: hypothetical protein QGF58_29705, partial [Myxococcota bacterium]|nr:hypothetical protein [Myxococcota bacterium]